MPPNNTTKQLGDVTPHPILRRRMNTSRNLRREVERLRTYANWPLDFLEPKRLAAEGFYYTGESDIVRCIFCGVEIGSWEEGDDVSRDHVKWSETCDLVQKRPCGNIPADEDEGDVATSADADVCGPFVPEIRPFSGPEKALETNTLWKDLEHLGVSKTSGPVQPFYVTYESRLATFATWPMREVQRPEALAEAGFYYLKFADHTMCFHCGGGLKDWEAEDDPWVEHARWFSKCGFIIIQKGRDYVNQIISNSKAVLSGKAVKELHPPVSVEPVSQSIPEQPHSSKLEVNIDNSVKTSIIARSEPGQEPSTSTSVEPRSSSPNKELSLCLICFSQERAIVFLPCGHFVSCVKCAPSLTTCALCRKPYEATIRAYLS